MDGREKKKVILRNQPGGRVIEPLPGRPNKLVANSNQPVSDDEPGAPYNQRHAPTSHPTTSIFNNPTISYTSASPNAVKGSPATTASAESPEMARLRYHSAWQNYYQKYYENYYVAALQAQRQQSATRQPKVTNQSSPSTPISQADIQQQLRQDILGKIKTEARRVKKRPWFWPVASAVLVVIAFLFLQYNSVLAAKIANFISPGSSSNQTIIVGTGEDQVVSDSPRIIIPKINVNAPVTYGLTDLSEKPVQTALQNGPINYPVPGATAVPGQKGNTVILGHSSADVFAPGDYKFIFVQLNRLTTGDLFYLDYGTTRYAYKVTNTKIINPDQLDALNLGIDKPYATLVTCDPPGTIARRLLIIAEQVSPNPNKAEIATTSQATHAPKSITGKPKTLLEAIFGGK